MAAGKSDKQLPVWHPSLKKLFKSCDRWIEWALTTDRRPTKYLERIEGCLAQTGILKGEVWLDLGQAGHTYAMQTCALSGQGRLDELAQPLRWAVAMRSIAFRFEAAVTLAWTTERQPLLSFGTSMKVAATAMLSQWDATEAGARFLIQVAHKDQALKPDEWRREGWGKGTNDAFLIFLFAQAFGIPTHYQPVHPLIPEYQAVLDQWRSTDAAVFQTAMQAALDWHITRSKDSTERNTYEFDESFNGVYPAELLAVQALRQRDGLPHFDTGHLLIDTPWAILSKLPECPPHPLAMAVEERVRRDYPDYN
ncbi:hypothetical protein LGM68_11150 [Xanthomonas citri pv. malvacearum]|uniref:hypothetical protein n=1 Tax=Xanthomonas citri TaxID=346 RepID=UPI0022AEBD80|nr:hypothetical protein [Xanthomonas citri]WAW97318.1 hypothetical protein LGM68_11150 [Xanthomonas citri pv. malvacearum]